MLRGMLRRRRAAAVVVLLAGFYIPPRVLELAPPAHVLNELQRPGGDVVSEIFHFLLAPMTISRRKTQETIRLATNDDQPLQGTCCTSCGSSNVDDEPGLDWQSASTAGTAARTRRLRPAHHNR